MKDTPGPGAHQTRDQVKCLVSKGGAIADGINFVDHKSGYTFGLGKRCSVNDDSEMANSIMRGNAYPDSRSSPGHVRDQVPGPDVYDHQDAFVMTKAVPSISFPQETRASIGVPSKLAQLIPGPGAHE